LEVILYLEILKAEETTLPVIALIYQNICACEPFGKTSFIALLLSCACSGPLLEDLLENVCAS